MADIINGLFEAFAALFILNHCRVLWQTKQPHGVSLLSTFFFTVWGVYNVWYFPHLGQMFSFYCGISVVIANLCWVGSIIYLRRNP
jgi:hypothetical protein